MTDTGFVNEVREAFGEQIRFRGLLWQMTKRDLLLRYKQTVMGFAWAVFMPLVHTAVFATVVSRLAHIDPGVPYPLFAFTGVLAWNFFASSLKFASTSLSSNVGLVSKVYFPREIFPLSQVAVCFVDAAVAGVVVVALMGWYGVAPGWSVLWLPVVVTAHVSWTAAAALILAMANLFYRDVKYLVEGIMTVAVFSTTALYPATVAGGSLGALMAANPLSVIMDGYRSALFRGPVVDGWSIVAAAVLGLVVFLVASLTFHRAEHQFAENV